MPNTINRVEIDPVREKLVELIDQVQSDGCDYSNCHSQWDRPEHIDNSVLAEHLIANGVTVQEWISVNDRLPELIPSNAGTAYSEAVNVLTTGRKVLTAIWDGADFIADAEFWEAEGEEITHWTPVLLPLPQPPEGE